MNIGKDTVVTITYIVRDMEGKLLEESDEPVSYLHGGYDNIFPMVEQVLEGKGVGDKIDLKLQPADAFGEYEDELVRLEPREGRFHQLLGDIDVNQKRHREALPHYERAIALSPGYFGSWLGAGVAQYRAGDRQKAMASLTRSWELLPTAPAALFLGNIARDGGDSEGALKYYQAAASAQGSIGQEATREAIMIDLPRNPGKYVGAALRVGSDGVPLLVVQNRSPVALASIQVTPVLVNPAGQVVRQGRTVDIRGPVRPGEQVASDAGLASLTPEQLQAVRFRIEAARIE